MATATAAFVDSELLAALVLAAGQLLL